MAGKENSQGVKRLLSVEETALYLGISCRTIYNQIGRKAKRRFPIPIVKVGRTVKFDRLDIEKFIDAAKL